jgi:hypothetical protein
VSRHIDNRTRLQVERIWARHWQRRALRLQQQLAVMRQERDELRRRLEARS